VIYGEKRWLKATGPLQELEVWGAEYPIPSIREELNVCPAVDTSSSERNCENLDCPFKYPMSKPENGCKGYLDR
jgi:hypothetical protein